MHYTKKDESRNVEGVRDIQNHTVVLSTGTVIKNLKIIKLQRRHS